MIAVPSLIVTTIILAVLGLGSGPNLPLTFTIAQERVPLAVRGRFFGLRSALSNAASPLGLVLAGYLLDVTSLRSTIMVLACGCVLLVGNVLVNPVFADLNAPDQ
jgi:MFS family permease